MVHVKARAVGTQVQAWLGHSDITTTMSYIGTDEGDGGGAVDFVRYSNGDGV